jgi:glutaconate CoA-transferase subunit B
VSGYTTEELMACVIARDLADGEVGLTGFAGSGRAGVLAVGIPIAAMGLARAFQAPDLTILLAGSIVNPEIGRIDTLFETGEGMATLPAEARISTADMVGMAMRGDITFGFSSAAQVDRFGNVNITAIGSYAEPRVRLLGTLFLPEHYTCFRREYLVMDHNPRAFVERVDFITGPGGIDGGDSRERAGLKYGGPRLLVTDRAVIAFDGPGMTARLVSVHPGELMEDVVAATGFTLLQDGATETAPPTAEELQVLSEKVDPRGVLLGG